LAKLNYITVEQARKNYLASTDNYPKFDRFKTDGRAPREVSSLQIGTVPYPSLSTEPSVDESLRY